MSGSPARSATYVVNGGDTVLGEVQIVTAKYEDTFLDLGRRHGVGYEEIVAANPGVDPWLPGEGTRVVIPSRYVLPDGPRQGIVVSLAEHRESLAAMFRRQDADRDGFLDAKELSAPPR